MKKTKAMTLIEIVVAITLLVIFLAFSFYSSAFLLKFVQNRLKALPNYVTGVGRIINVVYIFAGDIQRSLNFKVNDNTIIYTTKKSDGSYETKNINLTDVVAPSQLGGTLSATNATIGVSVISNEILIMDFAVDDNSGYTFSNRIVTKKLINAVPVISPNATFTLSIPVVINLEYPAKKFADDNNQEVNTIEGLMLVHTATPQEGFVTLKTINTLQNVVNIGDVLAYQTLVISLDPSESLPTDYDYFVVEIPKMFSVDDIITPKYYIEVR